MKERPKHVELEWVLVLEGKGDLYIEGIGYMNGKEYL